MLEIDHLSKSFGAIQALDGMSFRVNPGELFGFVGSNGAGKTTCMRIILGVLAQDSGEVRWHGTPLDFSARKKIGYMPEERGLYPKMKVGDQLVYLARLHGLSKDDAESAMLMWTERLDLAHRREDHVQKLSLGNQQRVQLAASLMFDPDILVLDEPFSGLDPVAVDVMSDVMKEKVSTGIPVVFSSHQLDLVERLCDRVGIVAHGKTIQEGTIDELRDTGALEYRVVTSSESAPDFGSLPVEVVSSTPTAAGVEHLVSTSDPALEQDLLRTALSQGEVHEFGRRRPHLAELFKHVVSSNDAPPEENEPEPAGKKSWFSRRTK